MKTSWGDMWPLLWPAVVETAQMVSGVLAVTAVLGIPLGLFLHACSSDGLAPRPLIYRAVGTAVNILRSMPFLVLMAALVPATRFFVGTSIGATAAMVPLAIGAIPYYARLVEAVVREVPPDVIDVAKASGASKFQTIIHVQLVEALPGLLSSLTVVAISLLGYTAMAGAVGGGGIGDLAINYGYTLFDANVMIATVVLLVIIVQLIQIAGDFLVRAVSRR